MQGGSTQGDRRAWVRPRIAQPCTVWLEATGEVVSGVLRERNKGGARVKLSTRALVLSGMVRVTTGAEQEPYRVVWQEGAVVGLKTLRPS